MIKQSECTKAFNSRPECFGTVHLYKKGKGKIHSRSPCQKCLVVIDCLQVKAAQALIERALCLGKMDVLPKDGNCFYCKLEKRCKTLSRELGVTGNTHCPSCGSLIENMDLAVNAELKETRVVRFFKCPTCHHRWGCKDFVGTEQEDAVMNFLVPPKCIKYGDLEFTNLYTPKGPLLEVIERCEGCRRIPICLYRVSIAKRFEERKIEPVKFVGGF